MTATLNPEQTIAEIVTARPSRSRIFEKLGIDYCCGGKLSLTDACAKKGLHADTVIATIKAMEEVSASGKADEPDPALLGLTELCDHIEQTHHLYLREELPRIEAMAAKVADRHGAKFQWTVQLAEVYNNLNAELTSHMAKEERVLFPAIRDLDAGKQVSSPCGHNLTAPMAMMEMEHDSAGQALELLRELSQGYTPPEDACNTFRALLDALHELEQDLHLHIHKENNILFPRVSNQFCSH